MNESEKLAFFSRKPNTPMRLKMGGKKLAFANFPQDLKDKVIKRLAEKDEVLAKASKGVLIGLKIDGREVTRDNIHEFEKGYKKESKKEVKIEEGDIPVKPEEKYTKDELEGFSFSKLKRLARKLGEIGRSKVGLIRDILKHF